MKIKLTFKSPLLDDDLRQRLSRVVRSSALELESDIKTFIQSSKPAGRLYRRGAITRAASKNTKALGLKHFKNSKGKERAVVAYKFHRASAKGQPPAIDTGGLIGSIASRDLALLRSRVSVGKKYGEPLERKLQRYFFRVRVIKFKPKFKERISAEIRG